MRRDLVAFIDRLRADLADAAISIEQGDLDGAVSRLRQIAKNALAKAAELRA